MVNYTPSGRFEQQDTGSNLNTHGDRLNENVIARVDEMIAGFETIALTGANITLTSANGVTDQARKAMLRFTGTGGVTVTVPSVSKTYDVINDSTGAVAFSAGGTTASVAAGARARLLTGGTNFYAVRERLDEIQAPTASVGLNSQKITNLANGTANADAVNLQQLNTAIAAITASTTPGTVRVSSQDTTARYLGDAIVGSGITVSIQNTGADETLLLTVDPVDVAGGATETSTGSSVTLTSASKRVQAITPSASISLFLPDARTLEEGGPTFVIPHAGTANTIAVRDNAGSLLSLVTTGQVVAAYLRDNSTAAGSWTFAVGSNATGLTNTQTDVFETAATTNINAVQLATDLVLLCYVDSGNSSYPTAVAVDYSSGTPTYGSPFVVASVSAADGLGVDKLTGTTALLAYSNANTSGIAVVLTVNTSTLAVTADTANQATFESADCAFISVAAGTATSAAIVYQDTANSNALTVAEVTIANGTEVTAAGAQTNSAACNQTRIRRLTDTTCFVAYNETGGTDLDSLVVTLTGGTPTLGSVREIDGGGVTDFDIIRFSATQVMSVHKAGAAANARAMTISGTTITQGSLTSGVDPAGATAVDGIAAGFLTGTKGFFTFGDDTDSDQYYVEIDWNSGTPLAGESLAIAGFENSTVDGSAVALVSAEKRVIAFRDEDNSNYGTAALIEEVAS